MSKVLQQDLVMLGYGKEVGAIDGIVGAKTKGAIRQLQRDREIGVDGIAGHVTKGEIATMKARAGLDGTRNFHIDEFRSPDNQSLPKGGMDKTLLLNLELLRWKLNNKPLFINSGYRTRGFNEKVGGIWNSNHLTGKAADIKSLHYPAREVHKHAVQIFNGVGKYRNFTHVDTDSKRVHFTGAY